MRVGMCCVKQARPTTPITCCLMTVLFWCAEHSDTMADTKEAEAEITLETYDKHHVKVPKSIATRSAIINMMIEGEPF